MGFRPRCKLLQCIRGGPRAVTEMTMKTDNLLIINRRRTLALLAGAGAGAILGPAGEGDAEAAITCVPVAAAQTEGPYWVEEKLQRSDIRVDLSDGSVKPGVLLALTINVQEVTTAGCTPLAGAQVDIWHCDAAGLYSDEAANNTVGKRFL